MKIHSTGGVWVLAFGLSACLVVAGSPSRAASAAGTVLGPEAAKVLPLADAHFHVMPYMSAADLVGYMDRNGVRWAGGANVLPGGLTSVAEVHAALGKRFIRGTGQGQWLALKLKFGVAALEDADSPAFKQALESMERDLRDNGARVIGEIHVNTLASAPNAIVYHKVKADAPTLRAMFDLAARYRRPLNVHAQWDSDTVRELAALAESNRAGKLILAHCGSFASAAQIRRFFEQHENVACDLSYRSPPQLKRDTLARQIFDSRRLAGDWKRLIEDYPERFVVGIDDVHSWEHYEETVHAIRYGLLANLAPEVAEKAAYRNAQAWFGLE
jgi:predicted TIM-barrel fold metal-dependent hydrolase